MVMLASNKPFPGERVFDGEMRLYWPAQPKEPDYGVLDHDHIRFVTKLALDQGFRVIVPDPEPNAGTNGELWKRNTVEQVEASSELYAAMAKTVRSEINDWIIKAGVPSDYILMGFYGFPRTGRRVAQGRVSESDYAQIFSLEQKVMQYFNALFPSRYMFKTDDAYNFETFKLAVKYNMDLCCDLGLPVFPYVKDEWINLTQWDRYLKICSQDASDLVYWDSNSSWPGISQVKFEAMIP